MSREGQLSPVQAEAWRTFVEMQEVLRGRLEQQLQRTSNLSNADYSILVVLSEAPDRRARVYELGETLGWEKSRLHHQLTRMAARGLVRRVPVKDAPRAMYAVLTDVGLQAITDAAPAHAAEVKRLLLDRLTDQQLEQLSTISHRVLDGLHASESQ